MTTLRYAILSDIHANLQALEAVLQRLEGVGYDRVLCLGDTVGYGASPNECCDIVREMGAVVVRGNHDEAAVVEGAEQWFTPDACACILWTRQQLSPENRAFLESLEPFARVTGAHLCHGSLEDPDQYTSTPLEAVMSFRQMVEPLCFLGHTHYAELFVMGPEDRLPVQVPLVNGGILQVDGAARYLINPGAVGQPRDCDSRASFALWDTEARTIEIQRVAYNIRGAQELMRQAGLPFRMSERLKYGV